MKKVVAYRVLVILLLAFNLLRGNSNNQTVFMTSQEEKSQDLDDWSLLQMAIAMTESNFDPQAVGKDKDYGVLQQVPIYVEDVNRILSLKKDERRFRHEDSFDVEKSVEMFNILQNYYNPEKDLNLAIKYQNKAPWYKKRVEKNIEVIKRMETFRKAVKESSL